MKITNELLEQAILFATEKHKSQTRKGNNVPYILHPIRIMNIIMTVKGNSKNLLLQLIVVLLHDVVEDCGVSIYEIRERFGLQIAALVEELTTDKALCTKMGKTAYLLDKMTHMTSYALRFKLADRLDNVSDMSNMSAAFKVKYKQETLDILAGLDASGRKLTKTHRYLIKEILRKLK